MLRSETEAAQVKWLGAAAGLAIGYIVGQFLLALLFSAGRQRRQQPESIARFWWSAFNLAVAGAGAWLGYRLTS